MDDIIYIISDRNTYQDSLADSSGRIFETLVYNNIHEWSVQTEIFKLAHEYGLPEQSHEAPGDHCESIRELIAENEDLVVHKFEVVR